MGRAKERQGVEMKYDVYKRKKQASITKTYHSHVVFVMSAVVVVAAGWENAFLLFSLRSNASFSSYFFFFFNFLLFLERGKSHIHTKRGQGYCGF